MMLIHARIRSLPPTPGGGKPRMAPRGGPLQP